MCKNRQNNDITGMSVSLLYDPQRKILRSPATSHSCDIYQRPWRQDCKSLVQYSHDRQFRSACREMNKTLREVHVWAINIYTTTSKNMLTLMNRMPMTFLRSASHLSIKEWNSKR